MKKKSFTIPFKSNFFKEQDPFHLVIVFFIIFFGTAIFFSIPTFYDYKKYNQKIEEAIKSEYKVNIQNLNKISFKFIPSPHLLIKNADLKIESNEKNIISKLNNIKIFISITELYKSETFKIEKIVINKANFYINSESLKNFINNLKKSVVNKIKIKNSTIFFKDKKEEIILISRIKKFEYFSDLVNKKKILNINGNIFDSNYSFKYFIDYEYPNVQNLNLEFKNPNIAFQNKISEDIISDDKKKSGSLDIKFLNNKNAINYEIINKNIIFINTNEKNLNFDLNGNVNLKPFNFNLNIDLKKIKLEDIEKLFYYAFFNRKNKYNNLSGNIKLNFNKIDYKIFDSGYINFFFKNSQVALNEKNFYIDDVALIEIVDFEYLDNENQLLEMKIKVNIFDSEKFNRLLFNYNKNKIKTKNLYFTYQFSPIEQVSFISKISSSSFLNHRDFYKFKNFQQLKNLLKDEIFFNLD